MSNPQTDSRGPEVSILGDRPSNSQDTTATMAELHAALNQERMMSAQWAAQAHEAQGQLRVVREAAVEVLETDGAAPALAALRAILVTQGHQWGSRRR